MRWERGADYGWSVPYTAVMCQAWSVYVILVGHVHVPRPVPEGTHAVSRDNNAMGMRMAHVKKSNQRTT